MSTVERIMELSDQTFAHRDVLALVAWIVDGRGCSAWELQSVAKDLGLMVEQPHDPERFGEIDAEPGAPIVAYSDGLNGALTLGRERLRQRFPRRAN